MVIFPFQEKLSMLPLNSFQVYSMRAATVQSRSGKALGHMIMQGLQKGAKERKGNSALVVEHLVQTNIRHGLY